jgi:hypothetical protein
MSRGGVQLGSAWTRELARQFRPGYRFSSSGRSKFFLLDGDGRKVRISDGRPVTIPNSPSSPRSISRLLGTLRKLGALE